jgi:hypothetical protein
MARYSSKRPFEIPFERPVVYDSLKYPLKDLLYMARYSSKRPVVYDPL